MPKRRRKKAKQDERVKAAGPDRVITKRRRRSGNQAPDWVAPDDMVQWMVDLVRSGKMCGASLVKGGYCMMKPTPHQRELGRVLPHRCNFHGGATPVHSLPEGKRRPNLKHGFYSDAILPGEEEIYAGMLRSTDSLDHEIAICKLRLRRAVKAEADQQQMIEQGGIEDAMQVTERTKSTSVDVAGMSEVRNGVKKELVDYGRRVHAITLELAKLYQQRAMIDGTDLDASDKARLAREALREAKASLGIEDDE